MTLLAGTLYDPASAASASTATRIAMTAFDTTNLRLSFTAPSATYDGSHAAVLVRLRGCVHGATTQPQLLLGVLESSTIKARMSPIGSITRTVNANMQQVYEALCVVPGLTPSASLTWDAAYSVDVLVASTAFKWGGPNNTTTNDAFGGFAFEVYSTPNLLGAVLYDPTGGAQVIKSVSSLLAMTAFDTTNLRITFTAPASGNVLWRIRTVITKNSSSGQVLLGVLESTTVRGRQAPIGNLIDTSAVTNREPIEASGIVTGLTPGNSYTWDAAYGVEVTGTGGAGIGYGGPDNTTSDDAAGAIGFEVWAV